MFTEMTLRTDDLMSLPIDVKLSDIKGLSIKDLPADIATYWTDLVKRWLPDREIRIVADNSYSALEWLATVSQWATVITRLRLDAALYEPAEPRAPGRKRAVRARRANVCPR